MIYPGKVTIIKQNTLYVLQGRAVRLDTREAIHEKALTCKKRNTRKTIVWHWAISERHAPDVLGHEGETFFSPYLLNVY